MTACGPPNAATMSGMVTKGPMPTIWLILMVVAWNRPILRGSVRGPVMAASGGRGGRMDFVKLNSFTMSVKG